MRLGLRPGPHCFGALDAGGGKPARGGRIVSWLVWLVSFLFFFVFWEDYIGIDSNYWQEFGQ